jgi:hypothetical protein
MSRKWFARVEWTLYDILELCPLWTKETAILFLEDNEKHIRERMVEIGWHAIEHLIGEWEVSQ